MERRYGNIAGENTLASAAILSGATIAFGVWVSILVNYHMYRGSTVIDNDAHSYLGNQGLNEDIRRSCHSTCRLEIVESIPENLTFHNWGIEGTISTYEAWKSLIQSAEKEILMAAYKSSLRGKHVLNEPCSSSRPGEKIYDQLKRAALEGGVHILAVENDPPKDPGDNEDALALAKVGALQRRSLHMDRILEHAGVMHSKFFIVDNRHFYLGSANFDWRSLNQKMELGFLVTDCPCLAADLRILFDTYWKLAELEDETGCNSTKCGHDPSLATNTSLLPFNALTNRTHPLTITYGGSDVSVYLASSPRDLNDGYRTWDLEAIVEVIDEASTYLYVNVMDYIPMIVYQKPRRFWPIIDDAIRRAVIERGVEVRILTAALHFVPETFGFLESLQIIGNGPKYGNVSIRILTVPIVTQFHQVIARDRRTHRKFVVTDQAVIVGTSNWSGDYFTSTTGAAMIVKQNREGKRSKKTLIDQMRKLFLRDYESSYARDLHDYMAQCFDPITGRDTCRPEKIKHH